MEKHDEIIGRLERIERKVDEMNGRVREHDRKITVIERDHIWAQRISSIVIGVMASVVASLIIAGLLGGA